MASRKKFVPTAAFIAADQRLLDLQAVLCRAKLAHRADQIDILRRAVNVVLDCADAEVREANRRRRNEPKETTRGQ